MIFDGIDRWPQNEPLVEVRSHGRLIDLHNWASFLGFVYQVPESLWLLFEWDASEGGIQSGSTNAELRLHFKGVRDLRVERSNVEEEYESETLREFFYSERQLQHGWVQFTMMDGFVISFEAGTVALEQLPAT